MACPPMQSQRLTQKFDLRIVTPLLHMYLQLVQIVLRTKNADVWAKIDEDNASQKTFSWAPLTYWETQFWFSPPTSITLLNDLAGRFFSCDCQYVTEVSCSVIPCVWWAWVNLHRNFCVDCFAQLLLVFPNPLRNYHLQSPCYLLTMPRILVTGVRPPLVAPSLKTKV